MDEGLEPSRQIWLVITHLGSASIILPLVVIAALSLWGCGQRAALRDWLLALTAASALTLVSKILFMGWGIGIAAINFTGISGHAVLAAAVLPLLCAWQWAPLQGPYNRLGAALGLLLAALVALSRVVLRAHSYSEVALGWLLGFLVSAIVLAALQAPTHRPWATRLSMGLLLLALVGNVSAYLPTHHWETRLALLLSGHDRPYTRQDLQRPLRAPAR